MAERVIVGRRGLEWPTLLLIAGFWLAFGLITWFHAALPWWLLTPLGAYLCALHGSLQHEALHGHPTRSPLVNELLLFPPVTLWFPYRRYRKLHLTHHRNDFLTDPAEDPESYYMDPQAWAATPTPLKWLYTANNTMLGRFLLGPGLTVVRFWSDELRRALRGERHIVEAWALHALGIAMVWLWVSYICGMPFWAYVLGIAYWGNSITMMRSYAEHRAHDQPGCRTIVVESNPLVSLLYLNNNLHMAHHEVPPLAWYELPAYYRAHKERLLRENCAYVMKGYRSIARRWLFKPKEPVAHPHFDSLPKLRDPRAVY
jgi:fatty acid desaturase